MVADAFDPPFQRQRQARLSEFKVSEGYTEQTLEAATLLCACQVPVVNKTTLEQWH